MVLLHHSTTNAMVIGPPMQRARTVICAAIVLYAEARVPGAYMCAASYQLATAEAWATELPTTTTNLAVVGPPASTMGDELDLALGIRPQQRWCQNDPRRPGRGSQHSPVRCEVSPNSSQFKMRAET